MASPDEFAKSEMHSDFEILFDSFMKGKVTREVLIKCELRYVCTGCRGIYRNLKDYCGHFDSCEPDEPSSPSKLIGSSQICHSEQSTHVDRKPLSGDQNVETVSESKSNITTIDEKDPLENEATVLEPNPSNNEGIYNPSECCSSKKVSAYRIALTKKMKKLMDVKNLKCQKCDRKFKTKANLHKHIAFTHAKFKRYKCKFCSKFKSNSKIECKEHLMVFHKEYLSKNFGEMMTKVNFLNCDSTTTTTRPTEGFLRSRDQDQPLCSTFIENRSEDYGTQFSQNGTTLIKECRVVLTDCQGTFTNFNALRNDSGIDNVDSEGSHDPIDFERENSFCLSTAVGHEKVIDVNKLCCLLCNTEYKDKLRLCKHAALKHFGHSRFKCRLCKYSTNLESHCKKHARDIHEVIIDFRNEIFQFFSHLKFDMRHKEVSKDLDTNSVLQQQQVNKGVLEQSIRPVDFDIESAITNDAPHIFTNKQKDTNTFKNLEELLVSVENLEPCDKINHNELSDGTLQAVSSDSKAMKIVQNNSVLPEGLCENSIENVLSIHALSSDMENTSVCENEEGILNSKTLHNNHSTLVNNGNKRYQCKLCTYTTNLQSFGKQHALNFHQRKIHQCFQELERVPLSSSHKETNENLSANNKSSTNASYHVTLNKMEEKLVDFENMSCLLCDKKFQKDGWKSLSKHVAISHLGYRKYKCKSCLYKSNSRLECMQHVLGIHKKSVSKQDFSKYISVLSCRCAKSNSKSCKAK